MGETSGGKLKLSQFDSIYEKHENFLLKLTHSCFIENKNLIKI